jgi:hypothetical protein
VQPSDSQGLIVVIVGGGETAKVNNWVGYTPHAHIQEVHGGLILNDFACVITPQHRGFSCTCRVMMMMMMMMMMMVMMMMMAAKKVNHHHVDDNESCRGKLSQ